tara:strand:+ start:554 stop:769 length:216 start_codon:yes stop_codon:yes gene_type:complete
MDWRPIETVPDATFVQIKFGDVVSDEDGIFIAYKCGEYWLDHNDCDFDYGDAVPTHWRPHTEEMGQAPKQA